MKRQLSLLFVISMVMSHLVHAIAITQEDVTPVHISVIKNAIETQILTELVSRKNSGMC